MKARCPSKAGANEYALPKTLGRLRLGVQAQQGPTSVNAVDLAMKARYPGQSGTDECAMLQTFANAG